MVLVNMVLDVDIIFYKVLTSYDSITINQFICISYVVMLVWYKDLTVCWMLVWYKESYFYQLFIYVCEGHSYLLTIHAGVSKWKSFFCMCHLSNTCSWVLSAWHLEPVAVTYSWTLHSIQCLSIKVWYCQIN